MITSGFLSLLLAAMLFLQGQNDRYPGIHAVKTVPPARQIAISPDALRALFGTKESQTDITPVWKKLEMEPLDFSYCFLCETDVKFAKTGDLGLAVVRLYKHQETRFFVLQQRPQEQPRRWRITGYIDVTGQFDAPPYFIIETASHRWLSIHVMTDRGTRIGSISTRWFDIDQDLGPVLKYPMGSYHGVGWFSVGGDRDVTSRVISLATNGSEELLTIHFEARFEHVDSGLLFRIERDAVYSRPNFGEFRFDPTRSKMTLEEFTTLFDGTSPRFNIETFLKTCIEPLKNIAVSPDRRKRTWLRLFLRSARSASPEKQALLQLLNK